MNVDMIIARQQVTLQKINEMVQGVRKKPDLTKLEEHLLTSVEGLSAGYQEALEQISILYKEK